MNLFLIIFSFILLENSAHSSLPVECSPSKKINASLCAQNILSQLQGNLPVPGVVDIGQAPPAPETLANWNLALFAKPQGTSTWIFPNPKFNLFFQSLFKNLVHAAKKKGIEVELSPFDLFHGHLFTYPPGQLAIIFHAKEYPNDPEFVLQNGGKGSDSSFSTDHPHYPHRNFLWILKENHFYMLDASDKSPLPVELFLPENLSIDRNNPENIEWARLFVKAKTLNESFFYNRGKYLLDLNFFPEKKGDLNFYLSR